MKCYVFPTYCMDARAVLINAQFNCVITRVKPYGGSWIWSGHELSRLNSSIVKGQPDVAPWLERDVPTSLMARLVIKQKASNAAPAWRCFVSVGKIPAESSADDAAAIDYGQLGENKGFGILLLLRLHVTYAPAYHNNQQDE